MKHKPLFFEVMEFLWKRKAWWIVPLVIMLLLVSIIIIFSQSSATGTFIYAMV